MHKFLFTLLLLVMSTAHAQSQTVSVVWPFSLAGAQPNMVRQMIDNANKQQNKYNQTTESNKVEIKINRTILI